MPKTIQLKHLLRKLLPIRAAAFLICLGLCIMPGLAKAEEKIAGLLYDVQIPYAIGVVKETIPPGGVFQGRLCLLNTGKKALTATVSLTLPHGIIPINLPQGWSLTSGETGGFLTFTQHFTGGYDNWFELLQFKADTGLPEGKNEILLEIAVENQSVEESIKFNIGGQTVNEQGKIAITDVLLPYDIEDGENKSFANGTLILRNSQIDYYKNLLTGKGATSDAARIIHPLTHVRLEWINQKRQPKIILLQMRLLDKDTKEPIAGIVSPEVSINEEGYDFGIVQSDELNSLAMAELDGSLRQFMQLPLYIDDEILKSGEYLLELSALENNLIFTQLQVPVKIVTTDIRAAFTTGVAVVLVLIGLPYILARGRLQKMKSRHLITAGLFGTTAFAVVNIPSNFLNDIFNIFLGPFSFFISGMFSGILLYMLLGGLVILIPKFGIITLMLMVRMLINMFVFGHISPLTVLIYGSQAILLEAAFFMAGVFRREMKSWRAVFFLAIACGIADAISTYIILQSFSFLYRLFYADWYILLCMIVSGFIYPAIGAACGAYLGKELKKIGVD